MQSISIDATERKILHTCSQTKKPKKKKKTLSTAMPGGRHSGTKIASFQKPENNRTKPKGEKN
jgi:hypothetical protein